MRRANPFPALVVQAIAALVLGVAATVLVQLAGTTTTTIVLGLLLVLFFYALLTFLRAVPMWHWGGQGRRFRLGRRDGRGPRDGGGGWSGVREPRRPRWPGFPPRAAGAEPEGAERMV